MLDKIKSLFVVVDENAPKTTKSGKKKQGNITKQNLVVKEQSSSKNLTTTKGAASERFISILSKALEKNNLKGFDYLEFRQSLKSLANMQMDERTRFQSAAAMAKTMNVTPENLLTSAQHYLDVLAIEDQKFKEALKGQQQKQIGNKEENIQQLDQIVKDKSTRIQQLQKEIEADQKKAASIRSQIEKATVKMRQTNADFEASYNGVVKRIVNDVKNIKTYLQNKNQK